MAFWDRLRRRAETFSISISDPAFADLIHFGLGPLGQYSAYSALENPAFYRGAMLIAGTIATLPLKTYKIDPDDPDEHIPSSSFFDNPAGPYPMSPFEWKETVVLHLVLAGEVGLRHIRSEAGQLMGLIPYPPTSYNVKWSPSPTGFRKQFQVTESNGKQVTLEDDEFTQILGPSLDGLRGLSPVWMFRRNIALATAQEVAAMRDMTSGNHIGGLVTPKDASKLAEGDAQAVAKQVKERMAGPEHAGELVVVNREFEFTPWAQNNNDAQFLEQRRYSREDMALILGIPIYLVNPEKQSSWGTGIVEQDLGLQRHTLMPHTSRIEEVCSKLLMGTKYVEFDYKGLLQGTPKDEVTLLLQQKAAGVASLEEVRQKLGWGPIEPTDTFDTPAPVGAGGKVPLEEPAAQQEAGMPSMNGNGRMA